MNKTILLLTVLIVIVGIIFGVISFLAFEPTAPYIDTTDSSTQINSSQSQDSVSANSGITLSELASHNSQSDCWVGYQGKVYDLTSFLPKHPGSAGAIAPYCGSSQEFQEAFQRQHGDSKASLFMKVAIYKGDLE